MRTAAGGCGAVSESQLALPEVIILGFTLHRSWFPATCCGVTERGDDRARRAAVLPSALGKPPGRVPPDYEHWQTIATGLREVKAGARRLPGLAPPSASSRIRQ